jgi:hypothetical protein
VGWYIANIMGLYKFYGRIGMQLRWAGVVGDRECVHSFGGEISWKTTSWKTE